MVEVSGLCGVLGKDLELQVFTRQSPFPPSPLSFRCCCCPDVCVGCFFCLFDWGFFNSATIRAALFICILSLGADSQWCQQSCGKDIVSSRSGCSVSVGSSQPSSTNTANPKNIAQHIQVICIIDAKQHPTVQILSQTVIFHPHTTLLSHFPSY